MYGVELREGMKGIEKRKVWREEGEGGNGGYYEWKWKTMRDRGDGKSERQGGMDPKAYPSSRVVVLPGGGLLAAGAATIHAAGPPAQPAPIRTDCI
jgi:hypothetical protein